MYTKAAFLCLVRLARNMQNIGSLSVCRFRMYARYEGTFLEVPGNSTYLCGFCDRLDNAYFNEFHPKVRRPCDFSSSTRESTRQRSRQRPIIA